MVDEIASRMNVRDVCNLMGACKQALCVEAVLDMKVKQVNKSVIESIINSIKYYDDVISSDKVRNELTHDFMTKLWYDFVEHRNGTEFEIRRILTDLVSDIFMFVEVCTGMSSENIHRAWGCIKVGVILPGFEEQYGMCMEAFKAYLFGSERSYNINFGMPDNKYWFVMGFTFTGEKDKMSFSMSDIERDVNSYSEDARIVKLMGCIPGAVMTVDGDIEFDISDETMTGMAEYIQKLFGNEVFMDNVDILPCVKFSRHASIHDHHLLPPVGFYNMLEEFMDVYLVSTLTSDFW